MDGAPSLFLLIETPVPGELGPGSDRQYDTVCDECERRVPRDERIELVFDRWEGQHLFQMFGRLFASEDLRSALAEAGSEGAEFQPVADAKFKGRSKQELPGFHSVEITGHAEGPDEWWEHRSTCGACDHEKWFPTRDGLRSAKGPALTGTREDVVDPLPLRVYRDSWTGAEIFKLRSFTPAIVTDRFVEIAQQVGIPGVYFRPTQFVSRSDT